MNFIRRIGVASLVTFQVMVSVAYSAESFFVTQSGSGSHTGLSLVNAWSAAEFNTNGHWGAGEGKISGGDIVYLTGTITSDLTMQASGSSGALITIDGTNATMNAQISGASRSHFTFQNLSFASGRSGDYNAIECTQASNANLLNIVIPNNNGSYPINLRAASYITAKNINLDGLKSWGIKIGAYGGVPAHHITFSGLQIITAQDYTTAQRDIIITDGSHDITIEKSYIHKRWSSPDNGSARNDIWETWGTRANPSIPNPYNHTIRHSLLITDVNYDGNWQFLMWGDLAGNNKIYGNVFLKKGSNTNGSMIALKEFAGGGKTDIYNNTFVHEANYAFYNIVLTGMKNPIINIKNNIFYNSQNGGVAICRRSVSGAGCTTGVATINHSYNTWYGFSSNGWENKTCSDWIGPQEKCSSNPQFSDYTNEDFSLQQDSVAISAGIDLGSEYNQLIKPGSKWPNPTLITPSTMNIGAYGDYALRPVSPVIIGIK